MKVTQLMEILEHVKDMYGDIPITMLDDHSGNHEPLEGGFFYSGNGDPGEFQLCTERQMYDEP